MPTFVDYQNDQRFELEISPGMYLRFLNSNEKNQLRELLRKNNHKTLDQVDHEDALDKLADNYISLTSEELEIIKKIASRFI